VAQLKGRARPGDTVDVLADNGRQPLARAAWSPHSQIRARMWSFDPEETIDHAFFKRRVAAAVARARRCRSCRAAGPAPDPRRVRRPARRHRRPLRRHGGAAAEQRRRREVARRPRADALLQATGCARVFERSDSDVRGLEGLEPRTGWLRGEAPGRRIVIEEHGVRLEVDIRGGHKTGFYLDQRENRLLVRPSWPPAARAQLLLLHRRLQPAGAGRRRREVLSIDSSGPALDRGAAQPGAQSAARCRARRVARRRRLRGTAR
jgi:23S rRNA (cytosine1962-C5)-methyltransferase